VLVCEANPHNITLIFNQLMAFIQEIERALKCQPGTHCTLYAFLMDYIKVNQADISRAESVFFLSENQCCGSGSRKTPDLLAWSDPDPE
jgi:hypothetical protein